MRCNLANKFLRMPFVASALNLDMIIQAMNWANTFNKKYRAINFNAV